jgi:hypothetical protein
MAQDDHGIDPLAVDGEPDGDEMKRRREAKQKADAADKQTEAAANGAAIDDQPDDGDEDQATLFPDGSIDGDAKITIKNILPPAKKRTHEAKMGSTAVPMLHGLVRYGEHIELLVTVEAGQVSEVPDFTGKRGEDRVVMGVKDVQMFAPIHVQSAVGMMNRDQVLEVLAVCGVDTSTKKVRDLLGLSAAAA